MKQNVEDRNGGFVYFRNLTVFVYFVRCLKWCFSTIRVAEDGDESSDYSSANESFLDEDPKSSNDPDVLGLVAQGMGTGWDPMDLGLGHVFLIPSRPPAKKEVCWWALENSQGLEKNNHGQVARVPNGFVSNPP